MRSELIHTLTNYSRIFVVGGGSGGHITPILSLAKELENTPLDWIGRVNSSEQNAAETARIPFHVIPTLKLSTTHSPKIIFFPYYLMIGIISAMQILSPHHAENIAVFSKGGPGALAVGIAAWLLRIPLYIHESDTIPGRSQAILGKIATEVFVGFDSARRYFPHKNTVVIGQILDRDLTRMSHNEKIHWKTSFTHILVFCGSQGARAILTELIHDIAQFIHESEWIVVLGTLNTDLRTDFEEMMAGFSLEDRAHITILDWLDRSDQTGIFAKTQIAITRGSATTLAELDMFHIKKIIIPLPHAARNHQYYNALEYKKNGDILLEQKHIRTLAETLDNMIRTSHTSINSSSS